ncbi:phosphoenolpyruvate--protein phosphotransferase [Maritalea sp. S77]|uniref:phosphoenolpyruvate--protein phosphotransferase n=1 Tax=Maritalea sp. S77 TaxID=3415125 RepID=UPI003C7C1BF7
MAHTIAGPRELLRRLRETMAEPLGIQERLDKIVELIADSMRADVCSFYVLRDDGALELFATHGLKREAVHKTSLRLGEGLVGLIASEAMSLNLADAPNHPAFAYRPETGEDPYLSFLGVPVLRAGQTLGVLDVQSVESRLYREDETEALMTTATLLAEMVSTTEFDSLITPGSEIELRRPRSLEASSYTDGIALGKVFVHDPRVVVTNFVAEDVDQEKERLESAIRTMRVTIDDMFNRGDMQARSEHREILESYRMFAHDRGWVRRLREAVGAGLTAEAAVERVQNDTRARMMRQTDPYIRDRLHDLDDLANRLLRVLTGGTKVFGHELPDNAILVARNMGPAELLEYDRRKLRGVVLEEGGMTAHVSIVARSLGLNVCGQVENIAAMCETGDDVILDCQQGIVHLRPSVDVMATYADKVRMSAKRQERFAALRDKPSITRDGAEITLLHNSGLIADLPAIEETGAAGIGLFRTELQFMIASKLPRLAEQVELYHEAMALVGDRPIVFRLLDIGGDKVVPYLRAEAEENPAMGWRSLRLALDRPGLIRTQIRALLQAANGRDLDILVPMVTDAEEFREARKVLDVELSRLDNAGYKRPNKLRFGAMIEVPSLLFELDHLLPMTDFVSIGSNDLVQFLTASDRANARVVRRYDPIAIPRLRAFKHVADAAKRHNVPLTMCGELAGRPIEALALMAIGIDRLSMAASSIGQIKELVLSLDLQAIRGQICAALDEGGDPLVIRDLIYDLADRQHLPL